MRYDRESWLQRASSLAVGAAVLLSGTSAFAQQLRAQARHAFEQTAVEEGVEDGQEQTQAYWIGVACEALSPAMRAQLGLAEEQGVLIQDVVADSPAAQAGLKRYDVILAVAEQPIGAPEALAQAVAKAQDQELSVRYLRAGKETTATVKPAPRPRRPSAEEWIMPQVDQESLKSWLDRLRGPGGMGPPPLGMRFFHPGMLLPPGASAEAALPDDMSVTISKRGKTPATIHVERGDMSWDVTEDKLEQLPDDIRVHVERMLGRASFAVAIEGPNEGAPKRGSSSTPPRHETLRKPASDLERQLNDRMDRIDDQLRKLREAVEKLHPNAE
jgi:hypothetical protein